MCHLQKPKRVCNDLSWEGGTISIIYAHELNMCASISTIIYIFYQNRYIKPSLSCSSLLSLLLLLSIMISIWLAPVCGSVCTRVNTYSTCVSHINSRQRRNYVKYKLYVLYNINKLKKPSAEKFNKQKRFVMVKNWNVNNSLNI
jgi:hypothetical protein